MTKQELEDRAAYLEQILDYSLDDFMPDAEEELCKIYGMLMKMNQLEAE